MRVLVACEYSGRVRDAFRALGHDAYSCDLLPADDGSMFHLRGDATKYLRDGWDMLVAHPPCTYLTSAAEWAYGDGPYHQKVKPGTLVGAARRAAREESLALFCAFLEAPIPFIAVENPVGVASTRIRKPDQTIQPHAFGADASRRTCLWLKNLPTLVSTKRIPGRLVPTLSGKVVERWANQTDAGQNRLSPSPDRWKDRSKTYQGIADAMATQWGRCSKWSRALPARCELGLGHGGLCESAGDAFAGQEVA